MANSTAQKLKVSEGFVLLTVNAPVEFKKNIGPLPAAVKISSDAKNYDQIHWFVFNKAQVEKELSQVLKLLKPGVVLWIYYPKGSSKIQTDLTRDKGWETLLEHDELNWISLISFDDTWSTFGSRLKTETDKKRESKPKDRPVFDYVDPKTKAIKLPDDLAAVFKKNKQQHKFFNTLSFTNKKEYIEWIVTAKREETRIERIKGTIERLAKAWKNPANR
ncbi:MAG TPA: YdeI/OmpD-associated family protein [Chitinophagaceae bacterium]